jgi:sugar lactone lactonase YvrE
VDIDSVANGTGDSTGSSFPAGASAVTVSLAAGTYDLIPIDTAGGGQFTATEFCTCNNPKQYYWIYDFVTSEQASRENVTSTAARVGYISTAAAAFSWAPTRRITLTNSGWIKFFIYDNPISDNAGGVSLKIVSVPAGDVDKIITTFAGNGAAGFSGDGAAASDTSFYLPSYIKKDSAGNFYITDNRNNRIRRIDKTSGLVTTVAGNGSLGFSGDGGPAVAASLNEPAGLTIDSRNNIYFADYGNFRIRKIDAATGYITTVAGIGVSSYSGDGGPATSAAISAAGLDVDRAGNIFIADTSNNRVRKIDVQTGIISTVASGFYLPHRLEIDGTGQIFVSDWGCNCIKKIDPADGTVTVVAGGGTGGDGSLAINASIGQPQGVAFDGAGDLYIVGRFDALVRRVSKATGTISRVIGIGVSGYSGDGGSPTSASVSLDIHGIMIDTDGTIYLADTGNHRIRKITGVAKPFLTPTPNLPTVTPSVVGTQGSNDWYVGDVAVSFAVDLKGSAVQSQSGCDPVTVVADTASTTLTCSVTTRAGTTSQSVTIKRDATAPVVTPVKTPMPNSDNWNNVAVAVSFTGSDATSGVASCSAGETLTAEAASQSSVAGTCTDNAGNVSAGVSATDINIDMTPPVLTATRSPDANAAGWNNTAVTVTYTAVDALSGVPADACNQAVRVTQNGVDNSVELSCRDRAMNITSQRVTGINIDTIAPTAYAMVSPLPNAGGWHNAPATVSFSGTDTLSGSGLAGCAGSVTVSTDVTGRAVSGSCTDVADNVSAPASVTVNLDQVAPTVTITTPASGASYTQGSSVTAAYSCADARAGVVACVGTVPSGSTASTTTLGSNSFTVTAADGAGNLRTATINYSVVAATPSYTLTPTTLAFGSQGLNTSVTQVVTLNSTGGAPIPITSIALSGTASTQYSRTTTCGTSVPVGGSCTISVTFRPTSTGSKTATLTVTAGGGAGTKTVALSGTGATASYTVSPTRVSFGSVPRNTTSLAQTVSVTNTSTITMPITSIWLTGSQASQFVQSNNCGTQLAAGRACQVQVSFRPTTTGSKSASVSIVAGASAGTRTVALSGTGT